MMFDHKNIFKKSKHQDSLGKLLEPSVFDIQVTIIDLSQSIVHLTTMLFTSKDDEKAISEHVNNCIERLNILSVLFQIPLHVLVYEKMKTNRLKYNANICRERNKIIKYTEDTEKTGFIESLAFHDKKNTRDVFTIHEALTNFGTHFASLIEEITFFSQERGWTKAYTNQSLSFYLLEELGELAEAVNGLPSCRILQSLSNDLFNAICSEIADITIYLLHTCREYNIDFKQNTLN